MQYKIIGFNQLEAIKLGLSSDDLIVLQWFLEFKNSSRIEKNYIKEVNDMGYWVSYSTIIKSLPILLTDGTKYLSDYIELKKSKLTLSEKDYNDLEKKVMEKYKKKIQRILSGNLSKVLKRDICKFGKDKGSKVYLYLDTEVYDKLIDNQNNIDKYIEEHDVDNVDKSRPQDKSVQYTQDKSVQYTVDKSVQSDTVYYNTVNNNSVYYNTTVVSVPNTNKELIEKHTHLKIDSTNKKNTITLWDRERLINAIEIFKSEGGKYFKLLNKIYNDDRNFLEKKETPQNSGANKPNKIICKDNLNIPDEPRKTKFHNFDETFTNYSEDEFNNIVEISQKKKFG